MACSLMCVNLNPEPFVQKSNPKSQWVVGLSPREAAFMAQMPFTVEVPGLNVMIAHAGLVPGVAPKRQRLQDVYRVGQKLTLS